MPVYTNPGRQGRNLDQYAEAIDRETFRAFDSIYGTTGTFESQGAELDGTTDDTTAVQNTINASAEGGPGVHSDRTATALISSAITLPSGLKLYDAPNVTLRQADGSDIATLVTHQGWGNDFGILRIRIDGNRDNNDPVVGFDLAGTAAGDRCEFDIAGTECDTLAKVSREVEHCKIRASGSQCGTVLEVDTTTNTSDENDYSVYGYQVDTAFKTTGSSKSSGVLKVFAEIVESWAINLANGWYTMTGVVRGCGRTDGGGVRIASTVGGRIHFDGLQLYGQTPAPNNGTVGLMVDSAETWLEGDIILGEFDIGAWIKQCKIGSHLRINVTVNASNGDAVQLGDTAKVVDACAFDIDTQSSGTGFHGVNIDNARNCVIRLLGDFNGDSGGAVIGSSSFGNTIEISRRAATSRTITNNRSQTDNVVLFRGSYTYSDLSSVNGGSYFGGMMVEELRLTDGLRGPAFYSTDASAWVLVGHGWEKATTAQLSDAGDAINTSGKYEGKLVLDTTSDIGYRAAGGGDTDDWISIGEGTTDITPS